MDCCTKCKEEIRDWTYCDRCEKHFHMDCIIMCPGCDNPYCNSCHEDHYICCIHADPETLEPY